MPRLNYSPREVAHALDEKVCSETRSRGEVNCWVILDGKKLFRVTRPQVHASSSIPKGTLGQIRRQTRLDSEQFERLIDCPMSRAEYYDLLRVKQEDGLI